MRTRITRYRQTLEFHFPEFKRLGQGALHASVSGLRPYLNSGNGPLEAGVCRYAFLVGRGAELHEGEQVFGVQINLSCTKTVTGPLDWGRPIARAWCSTVPFVRCPRRRSASFTIATPTAFDYPSLLSSPSPSSSPSTAASCALIIRAQSFSIARISALSAQSIATG